MADAIDRERERIAAEVDQVVYDFERYPPKPELHANDVERAVCPYCNPEKRARLVAAKAAEKDDQTAATIAARIVGAVFAVPRPHPGAYSGVVHHGGRFVSTATGAFVKVFRGHGGGTSSRS